MCSFEIRGKVAIITGGGRGIGRAIALAVARAGADVVPVSRTAVQLEEVVAQIAGLGRRSILLAADVSDPGQVASMVKRVDEELGGADVLVNNAGISPWVKPAEELSDEEWDQIMAVNLRGTFLCSRAVANSLISRGRKGSIINISSIAGQVGLPGLAAYCASKSGIIGLTRACAVDWADKGIRVNAIAPGYVNTEFTAGTRKDESLSAYIASHTPMKRWAEPEEIAGAALFLASDASGYMTGQVITLDGGWTAS